VYSLGKNFDALQPLCNAYISNKLLLGGTRNAMLLVLIIICNFFNTHTLAIKFIVKSFEVGRNDPWRMWSKCQWGRNDCNKGWRGRAKVSSYPKGNQKKKKEVIEGAAPPKAAAQVTPNLYSVRIIDGKRRSTYSTSPFSINFSCS